MKESFLNVLNTHEWIESESNALLLTYIHVELLFSFLYFHFTSVALHDWSYCASQLTDFQSLTNKRTDQLPWHTRLFVQHSNWGESWALGSQGLLLHTLTSIFKTLVLFDVTDHYWPLLTFAVLFLWVGKQWYKKSLTPNKHIKCLGLNCQRSTISLEIERHSLKWREGSETCCPDSFILVLLAWYELLCNVVCLLE